MRQIATQRFMEVMCGFPGQRIEEGELVAFCTYESVHLYAAVCHVIPRSGHDFLTFWAVVEHIDLPSPYFSGDNVPFEKGGYIKGYEKFDGNGGKTVHIRSCEIAKEDLPCD